MYWTSSNNHRTCEKPACSRVRLWRPVARLTVLSAILLLSIGLQAQQTAGSYDRTGIHDLIDRKQAELDGYDGSVDGVIRLDNKRHTDMAREAYITLIDLLQLRIESMEQSELERYNDLVGIYNLIANINERSVYFIRYHHTNISNAFGIIAHKAEGTLKLFLYRHMLPSINNITLYKDEDITENFLKDAAGQYPVELLKSVKAFQKESYARSVLEHTASVAPNTIKKYFPTTSYVNNYLVGSVDPVVRQVLSIYKQYGAESRAYFFLDEVAAHPESKGYYSYLWPDSLLYLKELIDIRRKPEPLGAYSLDEELEIQALKYVRIINDMHLMKDAEERFAGVDRMNAEELYTLMVYSAEEIFTSTYNGLFERLVRRIEQDSTDGYALLDGLNFNRFRTFIKLAAGYNSLETFLNTMPEAKQDSLLRRFVRGLGDNLSDLGEAVNVADTFGSLEDTAQLKQFLQYLVEDYHAQHEVRQHSEVIYGLLIGLIGEKIDVDPALIEGMEPISLPILDRMEVGQLQNSRGQVVQQHFFFDDEDGLLSYGTFIKDYQNSRWRIIDSTHYVIIESTSGNKVRIFANKPLSERQGQRQIRERFAREGIVPTIMVHRGHSYYVHYTIDNVQPETRMVFLGSCGGYHNLAEVIERSPMVHIISSKQIGTVFVNNPLLYAISESIRKGEDIVWSDLWNTISDRLAKDKKAMEKFQDYIPPHKNLGAIFLQAYYDMTG